MATFTIPTIYTAVDRFSAPVRSMQKSNASFANSLGTFSARSERAFRSLTPTLSATTKQLASMASAAAIAGAVVAGATFSAKSIIEYEQAVASFHTIVGDEKPFSIYEKAINNVAKETKKSSIDTAAAFEKIAGLNAKFAESAESISAVSSAAITLSKASRDELGPSAENLVGIMNQFSLGADQANRTINVLAAGQAVGAASITQTSEAFVNFGSVAAGANITLEQSVGLVETLGKFSLFGAEAGTKLRGSVLKLQQAGIGYKSGQFAINDALEEAKKKVDGLRTAKEKDAAVLKIFGAENISTGKILLSNIELFKEYTKNVTNTTEAQKAAKLNSETLGNKLDELKSAWINMLTGSDAAGSGLKRVKSVIEYVTKNLDKIVDTVITVIKVMAVWKAINIGMRAILLANNIALGIQTALHRASIFSLRGNTVATTAYSTATGLSSAATAIATGNMAALNAVMLANPIGAVIIALGLLAVGVYAVSEAIDKFDEPYKAAFEREQALRKEGLSVIALRDQYLLLGNTLKDAEANAIKDAKKQLYTGVIAAKMQLSSVDPMEREAGVAAMNTLLGKAKQLENFSKKGSSEFGKDFGNTFGGGFEGRTYMPKIEPVANEAAKYDWVEKKLLNPKEAQATANMNAMAGSTGETKGSIEVNFKNAPEGTTVTSNNKSVMPVMKSTYGN